VKEINYIETLILQGESETLDFKYNISDSKKIAKTLVAFANQIGGKILVGVRDNGSIAGIKSEEELYMLEAAAELYSKPKIPFTARDWKLLDKTILEVKIESSQIKPHYALDDDEKWRAYVRINDNNIIANHVLLKIWKRKNSGEGTLLKYRKKEEILLHHLMHHDELTFQDVQKLLKLPKFICENILVNLICIEVIKMNLSEFSCTYSISE